MIHSTAIVHPKAKLASDVEIGAYSIIGEHVEIQSGTVVGPHVVINGHTRIGRHNHFYQFASIGEANQDKKYQGEPTCTVIGDHNIFRECCTVHRGTTQDRAETTIGSNNLLMAYTHVAHDCVVGNHCILANNASIAGHVHVGDWAIIGGMVGVHQFCHIGAHAFVGMMSSLVKDVPPFVMAEGRPATPHGINSEGLKRRGFSVEQITQIKRAYKIIYRQSLTVAEAVPLLRDMAQEYDVIAYLADFIEQSPRGIIR